ncbi:hypothetical protein RUW70_24285 [Klebsiella pneumoniae]|uniref:hypothetical protein n=1 Tax=Klebsiella pneumoniae TaxID=573 RepID=UPI000657F5D4|nr:hypothetical protein [Klebsiella pneumoniae]ELA0524894.1 hypothetical protein [Klebsiella pneumoniae]KLZ70497.1 hypothetical protein SL19_01139 [Klebsiella pneumoniae]MBG1783616.1 hypothetical protein [Klebsiella pneumoniae]MBR7363600.1 hypothetical protein [Klebsiella pneumoniae]MCA4952684.1 hypothetical protein [Klebsiella pneumoniae]
MESVQAGILPANEELTHELIYSEAIADAMISIAAKFSSQLPVDEIKLGHIYYEDSYEASRSWRLPEKRQYIDFNWNQERRNQTKRIDVSIRCRDFLCGLMLGRRSKNRLCITLRYLEGNPHNHPLKGFVMPIALIISESFADAYGIRQVNISRPDKKLIERYASFGYSLNAADKARVKRNNSPRAKLLTKLL